MDRGRLRLASRLARLILRLMGLRYMPDMQVMAAELGVSQRTLYRDLAALEAGGWQLPRRYME